MHACGLSLIHSLKLQLMSYALLQTLRCPAPGCKVMHKLPKGTKLLSIAVVLFLTLAAMGAHMAAFTILRFGFLGNKDKELNGFINVIGKHVAKTTGPRHAGIGGNLANYDAKPAKDGEPATPGMVPWPLGPITYNDWTWMPHEVTADADRWAKAKKAEGNRRTNDRTWVKSWSNFYTELYLQGVTDISPDHLAIFLEGAMQALVDAGALQPITWIDLDKEKHAEAWNHLLELTVAYIRNVRKRTWLRNEELSRIGRYIIRWQAEKEGRLPGYRPTHPADHSKTSLSPEFQVDGNLDGNWKVLKVRWQ